MPKKTKLPKTIAGMKIPKELRKKGGKLLDKAQSPAGREAIAAGLTMAAAAATAAVEAQRVKRSRCAATDPATGESSATPAGGTAATGAASARPGEPGIGAGNIDPQAIADSVGKAADALLTRLFGTAKP